MLHNVNQVIFAYSSRLHQNQHHLLTSCQKAKKMTHIWKSRTGAATLLDGGAVSL